MDSVTLSHHEVSKHSYRASFKAVEKGTRALPNTCWLHGSGASIFKIVRGVQSALISDVRMRRTHSDSKHWDSLEGKLTFQTVIEVCCGEAVLQLAEHIHPYWNKGKRHTSYLEVVINAVAWLREKGWRLQQEQMTWRTELVDTPY